MGVRWVSTLKPSRAWRFVTDVDVYQFLKRPTFDADGTLNWLDYDVADCRLKQRVVFDMTKKESVSVEFAYNDHDLGNEEGEPIYELASELLDQYGNRVIQKGSGEQLQARAFLRTRRLRGTVLSLQYQWSGTDDRRKGTVGGDGQEDWDYFVDTEHTIRMWGTLHPWQGSTLSVGLKVWLHDRDEASDDSVGLSADTAEPTTVDGLQVYSDREKYWLDAKASLTQRIGATWSLKALYRFMHYRDNRIAYLPSYHVGRLELQAKF
jgi:hypothetical protein